MNFVTHSSKQPAAIPTSPCAFPERLMLAACLVLLAWTIFLAQGFDGSLFLAIYGVTDAGSALLWRGISFLGSSVILTPVVAVIAAVLLWRNRGLPGLAVAFGWVATSLTVELLKWAVDRSRPLVPHWTSASGAAFPSGHAAQALYVYLFLSLTFRSSVSLADRGAWWRSLPRTVSWLLALVPAAVGYSRVCLGVHWPSDVVGGWAVGLFFCALAWLLQADGRRSPPPRNGS